MSEVSGGGPPAPTWFIRALLLAFPREFRARYTEDMVSTFRDRWSAAAPGIGERRWLLLLRTAASLVASGARERMDLQRATQDLVARTRREFTHSSRSGGVMNALRQDVSYALRFLRRQPAFTAVVMLTLALGIGMNTAVFSVLYGAMFQPLNYADEASLVRVGRTHPSIPNALLPLSPANYLDLREGWNTLQAFEVETSRSFVLTDRGDAGRHAGAATSAGFFDMLGVAPALGRTFRPEDDAAGAPAVVVLSDAFWRAQLGGDPGVLNSTIRLNDEPHTVIGIMPPDFGFLQQALWVPLRMSEQQRAVRSSNSLRMLSRVVPGATVEQAIAELESRWAPLREAFPLGNEETGMSATVLRDLVKQRFRQPLLTLSVAAGFVLLIACANVANLLLVRAQRRQREVGVRAALGAGRGRLAGQFLTEGVLMSLLGGVAGVLVAFAGVRWLVATFGSAIPRAAEIGINAPVLGFSLLASLVTGVLVGIAPALRARPDFDVLREGARGGTARFTRTGKALVVAEVALALMLVTGAGLLLKSYQQALDSSLGFDATGVAAASLYFPPSRYPDNAQAQAFVDRLIPELEAQPGIAGVTMSSMVPVREFGNNFTEISVEGRDDARASFVESRGVAPSYFAMMDISLEAGRTFSDAEARDPNSSVVVINRTLARQLFGEGEAVGWRLSIGDLPPEIVGVVADVRDFGPDQIPRPMVYFPTSRSSNLILRASGDPFAAAAVLRRTVEAIDPAVSVVRFDAMSDILDVALSGRRFQLTLIGLFAVTALLLSCVGIYGVLSYSVERQTREIGVRIALGAHAGRVAGLVAWHGWRLALLGVAVGAVGAYGLRTAIQSQLFQVQSFDPAVYFGVSGILLLVAALASFLPARRASRIQPTEALRLE